jgi:hypothetical protein
MRTRPPAVLQRFPQRYPAPPHGKRRTAGAARKRATTGFSRLTQTI